MLMTLEEELKRAVAAAARLHARAEETAARTAINVPEIRRLVNGMQDDFEEVAGLLEIDPVELQTEVERLFSRRAPQNVHGLIAEARLMGQAAVAAALQVYDPETVSADVWAPALGRYVSRAFGADAMAILRPPFEALAAALAPVAGRR